MNKFSYFVSCPRGLEQLLSAELDTLGAKQVSASQGGVACDGELALMYAINLHSRTASRVLLKLKQSAYHNEQDIYDIAHQIAWPDWFTVDKGFKIYIEGKHAKVSSLNFIALRVKDALCDVFRAHTGDVRPNVKKINPEIRIHVFIDENNIEIYLDTSGEALFKRGYRSASGEAPLRENLAAGLLLLAGYDGSQPFMDPFCGSGTLAIEAGLIATQRAPGLHRHFGFEHLLCFNHELWKHIYQEAQSKIIQARAPIWGSDVDQSMVRMAIHNAMTADLGDDIVWNVADAVDVRPNGLSGILISNPPYGVRLSEIQILHALYPQLGRWLKQHFSGWRIGMFTGDRTMPKLMRLTPTRKYPLFNGKLDCRLFILDMVEGSNRRKS